MSETNFADFAPKDKNDRAFMHILYAMHTFAVASGYTLAVIALIISYVKRSDETDALFESHHSYLIRTFWWTLLWSVLFFPIAFLLSLTVIFIPLAWLGYAVIGLWYLYRCIKGWVRFTDHKLP